MFSNSSPRKGGEDEKMLEVVHTDYFSLGKRSKKRQKL
jgi:hypothetical protein